MRLSTSSSASQGTEINLQVQGLKYQSYLCILKREESKVFSEYFINAKGLGSAGFRSAEVLSLSSKVLVSDPRYSQTDGASK